MELDNYSRDIKNLPIDKGYAWVVCFGAGVIYVFVLGGIRVWGILILHWQEHYGLTATKAISITAVTNITMSILCPLMSAIGNAYSERKVMFFSGFLMAVGTMLAGAYTNETGLTLTFGVLTGIGLAGTISSPIVIVGIYFDARRSLGNAMFSLGGSLGQLILPAVLTYLFLEYDATGAVIIFGALFLNIMPAALLCLPLSFFEERKKKKNPNIRKITNVGFKETPDALKKSYSIPKVDLLSVQDTTCEDQVDRSFEEVLASHGSMSKNKHIDTKRKSFFQKIGAKPLGAVMSSAHLSRYSVTSTPQHPTTANKLHISEDEKVIYKHCPFHHNEMHEVVIHDHHLTKKVSSLRTYSFSEPSRHSIRHSSIDVHLKPFAIASYQNLSHHDAKEMGLLTSSHINLLEAVDTTKGAKITIFNTIMTLFCSCCPVNEDPSVFPLYDWVLLRNRLYVIFVFGSLLSAGGYFNTYVMFPAFCVENGLSNPDVAVMLAILAVGDFVGHIIIGIFGDTATMRRHNMLVFVIFIMAGVTMALPFIPFSYGIIAVYCVIFSVLGGIYLTLLPVVCVDLLGIAELSGAYGLSFLFDGFFYFPVTILLGVAQDTTGKNDIPIVVCGSLLLAGGVAFAVLNYVEIHLYKKEHVHLRSKNIKS